MSDALGNPPSFGGNPGEPVPEVDTEDLKTIGSGTATFKQDIPAVLPVFEAMKAFCKPGAKAQAGLYRSTMIWVFNLVAAEQLAPWVKDEQVSDAVFRTMATIPMEWVGPTPQEGLPFDVEGFFRFFRRLDVESSSAD